MFTRPIRPNQNASVDPLAVQPTAPGHWPGLCVNLHSGKEDLIGSAKLPPGSRVHSVLVRPWPSGVSSFRARQTLQKSILEWLGKNACLSVQTLVTQSHTEQ